MTEYFHSVTLDEEKCRGCTNCIKGCPTEAIRVRNGKARITADRCVDCGECIRTCPYHAKKAVYDPFEAIDKFKYKIAIPAPTLYGQFKPEYRRELLLAALKRCGFDEVFEVAAAAEIVTAATKKLLSNCDLKKPLISSACPAVVRLIQVRYPGLLDNLVKLDSPMEVAARIVRKNAISRGTTAEDRENIISRNADKGEKDNAAIISDTMEENKNIINKEPVAENQIGVFFITPCAAKVTSVKNPFEHEKSMVDGAISIRDVYLKMLSILQNEIVFTDNNENNTFNNKDESFNNKDNTFNIKDESFNNKDNTFNNKDESFNNKDNAFNNKDETFNNKGNTFNNKDNTINNKRNSNNIRNSTNKDAEFFKTILAGFSGIGWANSGGEGEALGTDNYLAVDGVHNVIAILNEIENGKLANVDFVEALSCSGGCLGGPLTVENAYVAKTRIKKHMKDSRDNMLLMGKSDTNADIDRTITDDVSIWTRQVDYKPVLKLDADMDEAMKKMEALEKINSDLPGLDCGACGAPSCKALAEDIVRGHANETDCIFKLRERIRELALQMMELDKKIPPIKGKMEITDNKWR